MPAGIAEIPIVVEDETIQLNKIRIVVVEADDRRAADIFSWNKDIP